MNTRYFLYALVLAAVTTVLNWSNALDRIGSPRQDGYSTGRSGMSGGSWGGGSGGHK